MDGDHEVEQLSAIVTDLAEVVARLTHDEDYLAVPEGRAEAERLARAASGLARGHVGTLSPVKALAARTPVRVPATATIRDVARLFVNEAIGSALVGRDEEPAGIVTESDLARALAAGVDPDREHVIHWMTSQVLSVGSEETVLEAGRTMADARVRHLAVMDAGRTVGMVSARDVIHVLALVLAGASSPA
jgi:signal-transduction protein with cAMP-binding, CBS, and nucleotidyltransferase domain